MYGIVVFYKGGVFLYSFFLIVCVGRVKTVGGFGGVRGGVGIREVVVVCVEFFCAIFVFIE